MTLYMILKMNPNTRTIYSTENLTLKMSDENEFIIGEASDANANADLTAAQKVPFDLLGVNRTASPDIGAYQHIIFEE